MAKILHKRGYCKICDKHVKVSTHGLNHPLHLFLTLCTCGVWFIFWFLMAILKKEWRCEECGSKKIKMFSIS